MTKNDSQVTPENAVSDDAARKAAARATLATELNKHPRMKKLIVFQGVILIALAMFTVGSLVFKATNLLVVEETIEPQRAGAEQMPKAITGAAETVLAIRPKGADLKSVSFDGEMASFLFVHDGADLIIRYHMRTGETKHIRLVDAQPAD